MLSVSRGHVINQGTKYPVSQRECEKAVLVSLFFKGNFMLHQFMEVL